MGRIVKIWSVIFIMILLVGCQPTTTKTSIFSHEPVKIKVLDKDASYQRTLIVFHNKGLVSKLKIIDKTVFNVEDIELIKFCDEINKITYEGEMFDFEGFSQSSYIQDNIYTSTEILDYEAMDMKTLCREENWVVNAKDIINKEFKVDYDKLVKIILEDGYELVEDVD